MHILENAELNSLCASQRAFLVLASLDLALLPLHWPALT